MISIAILIEHYAGAFPTWLAPEQVRILTVSEKSLEHGLVVQKELETRGLRVHLDNRDDKIGFKIREHTMKRVPYMLVCGNKEMEEGAVAVRTRWGEDLGKIKVDDFLAQFTEEVKSRKMVKPEPKEEE